MPLLRSSFLQKDHIFSTPCTSVHQVEYFGFALVRLVGVQAGLLQGGVGWDKGQDPAPDLLSHTTVAHRTQLYRSYRTQLYTEHNTRVCVSEKKDQFTYNQQLCHLRCAIITSKYTWQSFVKMFEIFASNFANLQCFRSNSQFFEPILMKFSQDFTIKVSTGTDL